MKKLLSILLIGIMLFSFGACSKQSDPISQPEPFTASEDSNESSEAENIARENTEVSEEDEFLQKAYALGYTDIQIDLLKGWDISDEIILNPDTESNHIAQSSDGRYILGGYEIDFLRSCMYLMNTQTREIYILPDWQNGYSKFDFIDDRTFYAAISQVGVTSYESGIRLYNVDQPDNPYAVWNLTDNSEDSARQKTLLGTYDCKGGNMLLALWCETPIEWGGWVEDDTETYQITLIDYQAKVNKTVDTGIKLEQSKTGIAAPNFDKPNTHIESLENIVYFDIGNTTYIFDYDSDQISVKVS